MFFIIVEKHDSRTLLKNDRLQKGKKNNEKKGDDDGYDKRDLIYTP